MRHGWRALFFLLLAGCRATPARVATCNNPATRTPRAVIGVRQIVGDTVRRPQDCLTLLFEPLLAIQSATYSFVHENVLHRLAPRPGPVCDRPPVDPDELEAVLQRAAGDDLHPAEITLHVDADGALASLDTVIEGAQKRIDVLMYLWGADPIGWHVAQKLAAKAGPDLAVRVLVDGGGNLFQGEPKDATAGEINEAVCWLAKQPCVQVVRTRNPYARFDHRKLFIVDGRVAWSGGRNLTWEAFRVAHDLSYTLEGPLTGVMAERYERFWQEQGGSPGPAALPPESPAGANARARLVRTRPYESNLARTVYAAVRKAQSHIYVENPYFSDGKLVVELEHARRRGVDVRVVLTLDSGSDAHDHATRVTANRLRAAGVRVYLYPGRTHVKAMGVDGVWAYLGTGNFDPLSLRHNRELGVAVSHGPLVAEVEQRLFLADFRPEWEMRERLSMTVRDHVAEFFAALAL